MPSKSNELITKSCVNNEEYAVETQVALNEWVSVEIGQRQENDKILYYTRVNGVNVHEIQNDSPKVIRGLMLYFSNNFHDAAEGAKIRNWKYETDNIEGKLKSRGSLKIL